MDFRPSKHTGAAILQVRMFGMMLRSANETVIGQPRPLAADAITRELIGRKDSREEIEATRGETSPSPNLLVFRV